MDETQNVISNHRRHAHCAVCGTCGPFIDGCPTCRRITPMREVGPA